MSTTKPQDENIDYLHPDGKPATPPKEEKSEEERALNEKSSDKQIAEADGHHICSADCQKHHAV